MTKNKTYQWLSQPGVKAIVVGSFDRDTNEAIKVSIDSLADRKVEPIANRTIVETTMVCMEAYYKLISEGEIDPESVVSEKEGYPFYTLSETVTRLVEEYEVAYKNTPDYEDNFHDSAMAFFTGKLIALYGTKISIPYEKLENKFLVKILDNYIIFDNEDDMRRYFYTTLGINLYCTPMLFRKYDKDTHMYIGEVSEDILNPKYKIWYCPKLASVTIYTDTCPISTKTDDDNLISVTLPEVELISWWRREIAGDRLFTLTFNHMGEYEKWLQSYTADDTTNLYNSLKDYISLS